MIRRQIGLLVALLACTGSVTVRSVTPQSRAAPRVSPARSASRRVLLGSALATLASPALAFDNAIPDYAKYADKPKRKGTPPNDLGVAKRTVEGVDFDTITFQGLRDCDGKPNCFSTTGDVELETRILKGVDTLIPKWVPPAGDAAPFKTLVKAVKAYIPGQGFVDGGGFKVVKETDSYLYVQFEALKKGYIDDVEFAVAADGVMVRSSSRVGQTDFGVNACRLNYIAASLRKEGWTIAEITPKTHSDYFNAAEDARDQTFDNGASPPLSQPLSQPLSPPLSLHALIELQPLYPNSSSHPSSHPARIPAHRSAKGHLP